MTPQGISSLWLIPSRSWRRPKTIPFEDLVPDPCLFGCTVVSTLSLVSGPIVFFDIRHLVSWSLLPRCVRSVPGHVGLYQRLMILMIPHGHTSLWVLSDFLLWWVVCTRNVKSWNGLDHCIPVRLLCSSKTLTFCLWSQRDRLLFSITSELVQITESDLHFV